MNKTTKKNEPFRSCVICREKVEKRKLVRFVWGYEAPVRDDEQKKDGRGAYCCAEGQCLKTFLLQQKRWRKVFRK